MSHILIFPFFFSQESDESAEDSDPDDDDNEVGALKFNVRNSNVW